MARGIYRTIDERIATGKWPGDSEAVRQHNMAPPDDSQELGSGREAA